MDLLFSIGLGIGLVLLGVLLAFGLYVTFFHLIPAADRALTRMMFSDIEDQHAADWDKRNG